MSEVEKIINDFEFAIKNGDHDTVLYLLNNEISESLKANRLVLIRAIQSAGLKSDEEMSEGEVREILNREIIGGNELLTRKVVETILAEKSEWDEIISTIIGAIVKGVGAIVKGVGDAVANRFKAKAARDTAREQVKAERFAVEKGTTDILGSALDAKAKAAQALGAEDTKRAQAISASQNLVKITAVVCGIWLVGLVGTLIVLESKES